MSKRKRLIGAMKDWWGHVQNLDERPGDSHGRASGSKFMHGRAWLHLGKADTSHPTVHASWNLRSTFCMLSLLVDASDNEITISAGLPPVAIWFGVENLPDEIFKALKMDWHSVKNERNSSYLMARRTEITVHGWAIWWKFWRMEHMSESRDPFHGNIQILDKLFGKMNFEEKLVETHRVAIPMPERSYKGTVKVYRRTWSRSRWPFRFGTLPGSESSGILFRESLGYNLDMDKGEEIPHPGKGENSWDCGEDGTFAASGEGGLVDAIADAVKYAMRRRLRHGGSLDWRPRRS